MRCMHVAWRCQHKLVNVGSKTRSNKRISEVMYHLKKITKEDTWRSDDLNVHIKGHHEESRRRDRSKREGEHRKHRDGDSLDHQHRDPDQDARRDREKQRENTKGGSKHGDPDRDRNQDIKGEEVRDDRYKEKCREQEKAVDCSSHRDGDKQSEEKRREMENSKRRRNREKDRYNDGDIGMYKQRDRDIERGRKKDGEKERKIEKDRWKEEKQEDLDPSRTEERVKDKERDRRERHRARKSDYSRHDNEEKPREGDRRSDKAHSGHKEREYRIDRENREKRRRDKESHEADTSHSREVEREHRHQERKEPKDYLHDIKDGYKESMKARERKEQDRQRERKHKEDSDSKRNDRKQTEKHKESSGHKHCDRINRDKEESNAIPQLTWRSIQAQMSDPEISVENEETEEDKQSGKDYRNDDYEEDFENYEEDFEDEDEEEDDKDKVDHDNRGREEKRELSPRRREEIEAIQRAIDEENERISSARSQRTTTESAFPYRENHSNRGRTHCKFIDFVSAKHREISQKVAKKQKKRSEELLRLIDLDFSITFSLLDLPPVNEYDMYIKNFGTTNTKQAYVQCNEDNVDRDIQTEEVEMMDKWTQHPPEAKAACGGTKVSQETMDESMARMTTDSQRLTAFLRSAKQVMAVLIEENMAESNSLRRLCSQTDALSFSDGCLQLNTKLPFLHGRQVSRLLFSNIQRQTLLSIHPPSSKTSAVPLNSETIICVWNIWEPSRPQKILLYESEVMCCCFSPGKVTLVFAGTSVGSVVVWDLREHSGTHCNLVVGKEDWTLRYPTFSTDAILSGLGHLSPVVSIEPVLSTGEAGSNSILTADIDESLGLSFQLGSLDENGVLTLWVVVELPKGNYSGSQTDLGLRPGGKVKLLHSSSLQTTEKSLQHIIGCGPPLSLQLKFLPSDSNHYFVGTNMGLVRHGTRHSLKVLPKFYRSQFDSCKPVEVTTLDFSPSGEPFFLVGCSDGTVRLHSVLREAPLMEWSGCSVCTPILSVLWSQTRPAVFCVLNAASDLHIWDLTEKDYMPVITENIHNDRVTAMAVFGEPAKQNTFSGIVLAKQSGKVEIQYFKKSLTVTKASDKEKLQSVLRDTF